MQEFKTVWGPSDCYSFPIRSATIFGTTVTVSYLHHRLSSGDEVDISGVFDELNAEVTVISPNVFEVDVPTAPSVFPTPVGGQDAPITLTCDAYSEIMRRPKIVRVIVPTGTTVIVETLEDGEWINQKSLIGDDSLTELDFMQLWDEVRLSRVVGSARPVTTAFYVTADLSAEPLPDEVFELPIETGGSGSLEEVGTPGTYGVVTTNEYGQVISGAPDGGGLEDANLYLTITNNSGGSIAKGSAVRLLTSSTFTLAQGNSSAFRAVGIAYETIANSASGQILVEGIMTATTGEWDAVTGGTGGLSTTGATYFLDFSTAGRITDTINVDAAPASSHLVPMGFALSSTKFKLEIDAPISL